MWFHIGGFSDDSDYNNGKERYILQQKGHFSIFLHRRTTTDCLLCEIVQHCERIDHR